jgi:hypothetical protein
MMSNEDGSLDPISWSNDKEQDEEVRPRLDGLVRPVHRLIFRWLQISAAVIAAVLVVVGRFTHGHNHLIPWFLVAYFWVAPSIGLLAKWFRRGTDAELQSGGDPWETW